MASAALRRREMDVMKLMMSDYKVKRVQEDAYDFHVEMDGPADSPYEGGKWLVSISLGPTYPFKSPSVGFLNKIYHANIDLHSGSVCLDVLNSTWTPMYDLLNIFDTLLPQLLRYPNPSDPLYPEAAALQARDPAAFAARVRDLVARHATPEALARDFGWGALRSSQPTALAAADGPATRGDRSGSGDSTDSTRSDGSLPPAVSGTTPAAAPPAAADGAGSAAFDDGDCSDSDCSDSDCSDSSDDDSDLDDDDDDDDDDAETTASDVSDLSV